MASRLLIAFGALLGLAILLGGGAAWTQSMDGCFILTFEPETMLPEYDCSNQKRGPQAPVFVGTWYSAIAKSAATLAWGASWHETTQVYASRSALASCARSGQKDCKVAISGGNNCISLAESLGDGAWGVASNGMGRGGAITDATNFCRKYGGKNCAVVVTPCGREAVNTPPCIREYSNDISRGAAWAAMTPQQRALWNKKPNGACK